MKPLIMSLPSQPRLYVYTAACNILPSMIIVDKDKNTCTVRMVADHVFYENVGQGQESTVRYYTQVHCDVILVPHTDTRSDGISHS